MESRLRRTHWYAESMRRRPDTLEYVIRFVCGAVVGGLLGMVIAARSLFMFPDEQAGTLCLGAALGALVLGLLALRFGDAFWERMSHLWWWS